ncbi:Methyltransferase domain-containing protein [Modestobacter sp. DSM 44400]|uniref:class I SAM-dependent methyltransferase n=1 Tax=Modestobacter sp. DSM 44400 TaxID=1550230 RepID=UPI00089CC17D|nr:class I SAM-dependent methyltransferase [Modestobacter sp. DSM 44400]SDY33114.1 Methyltransferase domain-containing protein [Modestobacter sp. DSM 44400]
MAADFAGETALLYARYRRDLPADQTRALVEHLGLRADDVVVDLGCGTGQLAVPVREHCAGVLALDPEPGMLAGLRAGDVPGILCVLGTDRDLPELRRRLTDRVGVGAVLIGNALHWMDEPAALAGCADLLRPGGRIAVITQGPPMWLGPAAWQQSVRQVLERFFGPVSATCGSDSAALQLRVGTLEELGLDVQVATWRAEHDVDADWVIGHLGSALPAGALQVRTPGGPADAVGTALDQHAGPLVEAVTTTAVIARRPTKAA